MVVTDESNTIFKLAADFVNNTSRHIFLTGKAGTGKTTFLKHIKAQTGKQTIIVAPTGVAAINAGGVTMHSFFQLPFGPFIPGTGRGFTENDNVADKHSLFKNIRFNADKRVLLEELELLIIDEISMVRADMLDAMDAILRHFRKKQSLPFGGVQVLFIGDMYQLPPVVPDNEWDILQAYYKSPFFFSAQVIAQAPPLYIELKKIYRQNEQQFIDVLNKVRNNQLSTEDFNLLNSRYRPGFTAPAGEKYITLSTHNKKADAINNMELDKLPGKTTIFSGEINGEFPDKAFPTDLHLPLKEGAQVMFIKNDTGTERRFFNGKLAVIKKMSREEIIVTGNNDSEELTVKKETWLNLRYNYHKESNNIEEEELGSFTQYPLRLAWAITIHKSQGLTFEKAVIDAGASFAAGQVYTALSRCTSLQGLVLLSKLYPSAISTDQRILDFARKEAVAETLQDLLQQEQQLFWATQLVHLFEWQKITDAVAQFKALITDKKPPGTDDALLLADEMLLKAREQAITAARFQQQLNQLLPQVQQTGDIRLLDERLNKAIAFFSRSIGEQLIHPLEIHLAALPPSTKTKKYIQEAAGIIEQLEQQLKKLASAGYGSIIFCRTPDIYNIYYSRNKFSAHTAGPSKTKTIKGSSQAETLFLFRDGKPIPEIARIRLLAESTIIGHLSSFIKTGQVDVLELLSQEKINAILPIVADVGGDAVSPIKEILGDAFSFADIRIVMNHWRRLQEEKVKA